MGFAAAFAPVPVQSWKKLARYTFTRPYAATTMGVPFTQWFPFKLPNDVTAIRLKISNRNFTDNSNNGTVTNAAFGLGKSDGSYGYADTPGTFLGRTISGATVWASPWISTQNKRGADGKMIAAVAVQLGSTTENTTAAMRYGKRNVATASVNPLPAASTNDASVFEVVVEFYTNATRLVVQSDSLFAGFGQSGGTDCDFESTAVVLLGGNTQCVDNAGLVGSSLANWNANAWLSSEQLFSGAKAIVELGVNDVIGGVLLAAYQAAVATRVTALQAAGASRIVWCTVPPTLAGVANDAQRILINTWLMGGVTGVDAIADISTAVQDTTPSALNPAYDSGDGTHWNTAGHAAVSPVVSAAL